MEIRSTRRTASCIFQLIFFTRSTNHNRYVTYPPREQFTLLAALSHDGIHGNCHCNSICVCMYSFVSVFLPFSFSLISNLHLTPSWGKAPHSSTVFVPVTSKAPPAYQYQLRQCWACNLQLNVILLNPIWKLNIEKPLAYLPVFLPLSLSPLLATLPSAALPRSLATLVAFTVWHIPWIFFCPCVCWCFLIFISWDLIWDLLQFEGLSYVK